MTFFHFANCVALAYGPYFLTYKYSTLPEYGAFWKCVQVGGIYVLTQLCKMLLLATFFPLSEATQDLNILHDFIRATIDFGDILGMAIVMSKTVGARHLSGLSHIKVLITAIGWGSADLLLTRAIPLWVGAKGLQFDWKYIMMSLDANVNLVFHVSVAALVWLWLQNDISTLLRHAVSALLIFSIYKQLIPPLFRSFIKCSPQSFKIFVVTSIPTLSMGIIVLYLFVLYAVDSKA